METPTHYIKEVLTQMAVTTTLTISEQATGGASNQSSHVNIPERVTVRQLICLYIDYQISHHDQNKEQRRSFFIPSAEERALNGTAVKSDAKLNAERLYNRAFEAFSHNQIILLVDDQQAEALEQDLFVTVNSDVTFLKLMPLIGG